MKLKASVDYGIRTVLYLAASEQIRSSREISEEMCVPRDYLIQLALHLRNANIVATRPGKNGGYSLARKPSEISVRDIMDAFDNELKHVRQPIRKPRTSNATVEAVVDMHDTVMESMNAYLGCITVQDILDTYNNGKPMSDVIAKALAAEAKRMEEQRSL